MSFEVLLTAGAEQDIEALYDYIAEHDSLASADHVLGELLKVTSNLANFPERGSYPKELLALGIREYRQSFFKSYRVIYRVIGKHFYVYLIVDGRRDVQTLLAHRLLSAG